MFTGIILASSIVLAPMSASVAGAPVNTEAVFVEEFDHEDLSDLQSVSVGIMGDSISTFVDKSITGGSEPVYPDNYVTDATQMWWSSLNVQANSSVAGSYVTHREDGEYVNFNSDTRVGALGDVSTVIIYGGTCDLLADVSLDSFKAGLESLVSNVQYGGMRSTVLCTLPPIKHVNSQGDDYKDFNCVIRDVAEHTGSRLCEFEDAWNYSEIDAVTEDGVHPNSDGMSRLRDRFK